jgi:hypothetical protein
MIKKMLCATALVALASPIYALDDVEVEVEIEESFNETRTVTNTSEIVQAGIINAALVIQDSEIEEDIQTVLDLDDLDTLEGNFAVFSDKANQIVGDESPFAIVIGDDNDDNEIEGEIEAGTTD